MSKLLQAESTLAEIEEAEARVKELDRISPYCAWEKWIGDCTPDELAARKHWDEVMDAQEQFEERYL